VEKIMKMRHLLSGISVVALFAGLGGCGDSGESQAGADGINGVDGANGKNGADGADGEDGVDGAHGKDGADGADGEDGEDGMDGAPGEDGTHGQDGEDGADGEDGQPGQDGSDGSPGADGQDLTAPPRLIRLATTPLGAELTGMEKTANGEFFFNIQHPSSSLPGDEALAAVGAWVGVDVDALDPHMASLPVPDPASADAQTTSVVAGDYQVLGREGNTYSGALPFGLGNIVAASGTAAVKQSNNPDFNAFIAATADGSQGYLFTAWEDRPGGMSRLSVAKQQDGSWSVTGALDVDFSDVKGTIINCFGSVSPWGTPLTSEENYEAENTGRWNDATYTNGYPSYPDVQKIQEYLGGTFPNPYDYGYIVEITNPKSGAPAPVKHFTLGRSAHENPIIMPDRKTVYLTDDGSAKAFYKFVADTAGDLSAGTLYAAKVAQDATRNTAKAGFNIEWLELAHATNAQIESWVDEYDDVDEDDFVAGSTSYISDAEVADWAAGTAADDRVAFLETLRAAGAKGATVEFNKMEGININFAGAASGAIPFMYVAMADVAGAMSDQTGDIQIDANRCGVVYRLGLTSTYDVIRMDPVVAGGPYDATAATDRCSVNNIAQPDNILVLNDGRVLIGEDTSNHKNNMLWVFNPDGK
jgi:secreted PhoX family phosphatase